MRLRRKKRALPSVVPASTPTIRLIPEGSRTHASEGWWLSAELGLDHLRWTYTPDLMLVRP